MKQTNKKKHDNTWFLLLSESSLMKHNYNSTHFFVIGAYSGYENNTEKWTCLESEREYWVKVEYWLGFKGWFGFSQIQ